MKERKVSLSLVLLAFFGVAQVVFAADSRRKTCDAGKWRCPDNSCIDTKFRCNSNAQCPDGSDDENCEQWVCRADRWRCDNDRCIDNLNRCDGVDNCGDNSDEENCGKLTTNCPTYVMEKSTLSCSCVAINVTDPYSVTWPGAASSSNILTLTNVQRGQNGTNFTCRLVAGSYVEELVYTLLVAYGPHPGQVVISPQNLVRNGTETVTLTCSAQDTYPTPYYEWGGVPCQKPAPENTCTFLPDPTVDNGQTVTCRAESVTFNTQQQYDVSTPGAVTASMRMSITFVSDCGAELQATNETQSFQLIRYPNNAYCVWHISAPVGKVLWFDFAFIYIDWPGRCHQDYVQIYEGDEKTGTRLGKYCKRSYGTQMTKGGQLTVTFTSNYRKNAYGFRGNYQVVDNCEETIQVGTDGATLTSPMYPSNYLTNLRCVWRVVAPEGYYVSFRFVDFVLQKSRGCRWDSLTFMDGPNERGYRLGYYCGDKSRLSKRKFSDFTSVSNNATLIFKTSNSRNYRGFKIAMTATKDFQCPKLASFQCNNLRCVSKDLVCNGRNNCGDNSDELNCP